MGADMTGAWLVCPESRPKHYSAQSAECIPALTPNIQSHQLSHEVPEQDAERHCLLRCLKNGGSYLGLAPPRRPPLIPMSCKEPEDGGGLMVETRPCQVWPSSVGMVGAEQKQSP